MRTWLWRNESDWCISGVWFMVVEAAPDKYIWFCTNGKVVEFDHTPTHGCTPTNDLSRWEELTQA